ncbi:MAG TPA: hypothetical protein VG733_17775, partial [Chthoniobacteraceae bacterium]|nr:hypothetical protein [Chthoniobacteraceae bacterium]
MSKNKRWLAVGVCVLLAAAVWVVFGQAGGFGFINYDDNLYVNGNPVVVRGLSVQGVAHVFRHFDTKFYTPLTMISHMADSQFYGLQNPGGHHLTNVLLHGISALLLFLVLWRMSGCFWPAAFVAAVFAIHPLHVESVAWVSERNDVLAGVFFMLALGAYTGHARRPGSPWGYLAALGFFVLGLLSKPTLVPLPLLLLLLDWWPLGRFAEKGRVKQMLWEKIPFFALSGAAGVVAYLAEGKSVATLQAYPVSVRISNALISCVVYLRQTVWPSGLVIFYPRPMGGYPAWEIAGALTLL